MSPCSRGQLSCADPPCTGDTHHAVAENALLQILDKAFQKTYLHHRVQGPRNRATLAKHVQKKPIGFQHPSPRGFPVRKPFANQIHQPDIQVAPCLRNF